MRGADVSVAGDLAISFFGEGLGLCGIDIAGNHDDCVVRRVKSTIKSDRVIARELFHFVTPADHRLSIRIIQIERGIDLLGEAGTRIVSDALVLFFENDVALGQNDVIRELKPGHPIGLEFHDRLQLVARNALVVARVILRREGILLAADVRDHLREFSRRIFRRALEHQVLEEMRQSRLARRLVGGADFVPDHMRHDGRAAIRDDHNLQSVGEREVSDFGAGGERRRCDRGDERNQRQVCSGKHVIGPEYVAIVRQHEIG